VFLPTKNHSLSFYLEHIRPQMPRDIDSNLTITHLDRDYSPPARPLLGRAQAIVGRLSLKAQRNAMKRQIQAERASKMRKRLAAKPHVRKRLLLLRMISPPCYSDDNDANNHDDNLVVGDGYGEILTSHIGFNSEK